MRLATSLPNCWLRPWTVADKADLLRHADDRGVWINLMDRFPHPYTAADADHWFALVREMAPGIALAIEVDGHAVGAVGADAGEGNTCATARFGYWLGRAYWGRGIATAAAGALKQYLVTQGHFARLEAPVFAWNPPSMRVLEKIGFAREGVLRKSVTKDGKLIDSVLYAFVVDG